MAREMTPQERADLKEIARKLVLQINEITHMQWDKHDDKDQAIVLAALQTTRRAALLEAAQVIPRNWLDPLLKGVRTSSCPEIEQLLQSIKAEIEKLAQEGA